MKLKLSGCYLHWFLYSVPSLPFTTPGTALGAFNSIWPNFSRKRKILNFINKAKKKNCIQAYKEKGWKYLEVKKSSHPRGEQKQAPVLQTSLWVSLWWMQKSHGFDIVFTHLFTKSAWCPCLSAAVALQQLLLSPAGPTSPRPSAWAVLAGFALQILLP